MMNKNVLTQVFIHNHAIQRGAYHCVNVSDVAKCKQSAANRFSDVCLPEFGRLLLVDMSVLVDPPVGVCL